MGAIEVVNKRETDDNAVTHPKSRNWFNGSFFSELRRLVRSLPTAGPRLIKDISTVISLSRMLVFGGYVDDKTYIVRLMMDELPEVYNNAS